MEIPQLRKLSSEMKIGKIEVPYPESKVEGIRPVEEFNSLSFFYNLRMRKKEETLHDRESIQGNLPQAVVLLERFRNLKRRSESAAAFL